MDLQADVVDREVPLQQLLDQPADALSPFVVVRQPVVVLEQVWLRPFGSPPNRVHDVPLAEELVPERLPKFLVVADGLVHHVPRVDTALVPAGYTPDLLAEFGRQLLGPPLSVEPVGVLDVSDQCVAGNRHTVRRDELHQPVHGLEIEGPLFGTDGIPLRIVPRREAAELPTEQRCESVVIQPHGRRAGSYL